MALTVSHNFISPILDQGDPTLFGPDEWNDTHALAMAANKLLGRATAGTGTIEEITLGTNLSFTGTTLDAAGGSPSAPSGSVQYNNGSFGGDASFTYAGNGAVTVGTAGHTGSIAFKGTTSGTVTVKPQDVAGTWTFKWPADAGTNTWVLTTDGSGVTSWTAPGSTANLVVGTSTITGGTTKHVAYDLAGVFQEAANFTIESGNPNVTAGNKYLYDSGNAVQAIVANSNWFFGPSGNLTMTGGGNTAVGDLAFNSNTSGTRCVAIGHNALNANTDGGQNIAIGRYALASPTSHTNAIAIGYNAMNNATGTPDGSVAIGSNALTTNAASNNIAIGEEALFVCTSGGQNTAVGGQAITSNIDGANNFGLGFRALASNLHGNGNVAIGFSACENNEGSSNLAIGGQALKDGTTATGNIVIGVAAGQSVSSGSANILIGMASPTSKAQVSSGQRNISIGDNCMVVTATASNQLCIGNFIYGTGLDGTDTTISVAKIGIGVKAPACQLDVDGTVKTKVYTVGTLPTVGVQGARALVTDATVTTFASIVAGTGGNIVPVFDDGTNWRIG